MSKRNPNGYGCVTRLKGNRSRPWVVKVTIYDEDGNGKQVPIDYAETEEQANIILARYNNNPWSIDRNKVTLAELYKRWAKIKLPKYGPSLQYSLKAAYKKCAKYYGMKYRNIRAYHMQECIDNCQQSYSSKVNIKILWGQLDRFAYECDIIDKMYSQIVTLPAAPTETSRTPFTPDQIHALWEIQDEPWVDTVLIYIYTGFRLMELLGMKTEWVNMEEKYFQGGIKSSAGKNRIVPIHPKIYPLVQQRHAQGHTYLITVDGKKLTKADYYKYWKEVMTRINADGKTPHEARHTFETLLDNKNGNRKCIDMLMGHKSKDIGNRVYNHKTIEQLRDTINLLE